MVVSQLYSCGLSLTTDPVKPKPIAVKSKVWFCLENYFTVLLIKIFSHLYFLLLFNSMTMLKIEKKVIFDW